MQAGATSWKAFFFGSSDAASFITVDKPPASLWVMALSARVFGVNAWSILVPQALEGVAAVGVLYVAVRRWFSPAAGLLAGAVLALTPVAALMFRFNNPDALLTLLLTVAAYATIRAVEAGSTRWLVLAGSLVGFGFLTKMLQALLVVPALGLVYLVAATPPLRRRIRQLAAFGIALVVSAGWWVAIVELVPASARPYIGGSQNNSILNLIFGYNGFGRLTGDEAGSVGGGATQGGRWGATGWGRLFNADYGGQISWLLPAALILLAAGLVLTWRAPRTDRTRASMLLWGGWLVVTGAVFSLGRGIIHSYYTVALAPAIGAVVGIMATVLWRRRSDLAARAVLAVDDRRHGRLGLHPPRQDAGLAAGAARRGARGRAGRGCRRPGRAPAPRPRPPGAWWRRGWSPRSPVRPRTAWRPRRRLTTARCRQRDRQVREASAVRAVEAAVVPGPRAVRAASGRVASVAVRPASSLVAPRPASNPAPASRPAGPPGASAAC